MNEVGHFPIDYPSIEDGTHSASHLAKAALGSEDLATNAVVKHVWIASGAGLGTLFPADGPVGAVPEELKAALAGLGPMDKIDWRELLKTLLPLLLKLLVCVALMLGLGLSAYALPPQAPTPPQGPELKKCDCAKGGKCLCFKGKGCKGEACRCGAACKCKKAKSRVTSVRMYAASC